MYFAVVETYRFLPVFMAAGLEKWLGLMLRDMLMLSSLLDSCSFEVVSPAMLAFAINDVNLVPSFSAISPEVSTPYSMALPNSLL